MMAPRQKYGPGAVVLGSDYTALGIVRSLGRRGIPVYVVASSWQLAMASRYARARACVPFADDEPLVRWLLRLNERHGFDRWALFASSDNLSALVARNHERLGAAYVLTTPPWETTRWAYDKRRTHELAAELGVSTPLTWFPKTREQLRAIEADFPVILKPASKPDVNPFTAAKAWRVESRAEMLDRYDEAVSYVDPDLVMVQELIPGGGEAQFSFAGACLDGMPVAWTVARRTRQYPTDFGRSSTFVETIEDPSLEAPSRRILQHLRYTGLVELEFKRDSRTGVDKLLDINPRAWTWHSIGRRAEVDFAFVLFELLCGKNVEPRQAGAGVRWVFPEADVLAGVATIRNGSLSVGEYVRSFRRPLEQAAFAVDDPLPGLVDVPILLYRTWQRRRKPLRVGSSCS